MLSPLFGLFIRGTIIVHTVYILTRLQNKH